MLLDQWLWADGYQLRVGLTGSEGGQRGWICSPPSCHKISRGPAEAARWHWCKQIPQTATWGKTKIRLMLEIFPGEALNSYLGHSWSHCSFPSHGRQDKECQAAGLLPSWPHFTMSALLWKGCPRQCTRDAQPLHPSTGWLLVFFFLAPSNAVMFDRSDLFSCNEPLGKKGTNAVTSHHKSRCWEMNFATLPLL